MFNQSLKIIQEILTDENRLIRMLFKNPKFWIILGVDIVLIIISLFASYIVRFEHALYGDALRQFFNLIPLMVIVKVTCLYIFGLYRGMWRYTSTEDLINILKASLCAAAVIVVSLLYLNRFSGLSRSVFILDTLFTSLLVTSHRIIIRLYYTNSSVQRRGQQNQFQKGVGKKILLVGAGDAAEKVIRELKDNSNLTYVAVGLVDDDYRKIGMKIHGVPVLGTVDELEDHVKRMGADEILIAISSISGANMKRIVSTCQSTSVPYKVLPGMGELIDGKVSISNIREINFRDLLGRKEVRLDQEQIGKYLTGKVVLITGGGGSIGSELCRQIINFTPKKIVILDASEENLYSIHMELVHEHQFNSIVPILGKVQDIGLLSRMFSTHLPSVVFHAAAYKHVPIIENNPWQAVDNNIIASQLLMEAAIIYNVDRFVLVSTDKAVRPTNVMGASKRITELLMHAYSQKKWDGYLSQRWENDVAQRFFPGTPNAPEHQTVFMAVRFGNVLGSSGSVIPLFKRQIERGGPVTVTHPEITRYFMSIDEAAQLIIQAGSMGNEGGEIFILKMGEPINISHMAADLVRLAGKIPGEEIAISFTGLREGEKLYEELITEGEGIVDTGHEKIMVLRGNNCILCTQLSLHIKRLCQLDVLYDTPTLKNVFSDILPEYSPVERKNETIIAN